MSAYFTNLRQQIYKECDRVFNKHLEPKSFLIIFKFTYACGYYNLLNIHTGEIISCSTLKTLVKVSVSFIDDSIREYMDDTFRLLHCSTL